MDFAEIKIKSVVELKTLLAEQIAALHALKIQAGGKQLKQVHKISATRQAIARIQTVLANKQKSKN